MFSARAAELSAPAELSRFWTNHEPGNEHMQGGIRMDSSLFSYREDQGPLADPRPSLYENEGEDAGASSPSHMRNYLATIDRLPAKRSAAGRWRNYLATIDRLSVLVFIFLSDKWIKYIIIINRQLSRCCKAGREQGGNI